VRCPFVGSSALLQCGLHLYQRAISLPVKRRLANLLYHSEG
jgi:hypothetical protein